MAILSPGLFPSDQSAGYYPPAPSKALLPVFSTDPNSKITPQLLLALGSGLLSGNTWNEQIANAGLGANQAVTAQQQKQQDTATKNQTVAALQAYPDLANAVSIGAMTPALAYGEMLKRKQAETEDAKPKYTVIDGRLVQTNAPGGQIKVAADFSDPNAKLPEAVKTTKYWTDHPEELKAYQQQQQDLNAAKNAPTPSDNLKNNLETATSYRNDPNVKNYIVTRDAFEKVRTSSQLGTAQGDIGLVYGFMKMLDPTSVVREGEYATAQNSGGLSDTVINLYNKTLNGERLTPEQRQQFVDAAQKQYETVEKNLETTNSRYSNLASPAGVDINNIIEKPKTYPAISIGQSISTTDQNGNQVTIQRLK
jgi:hypothetical protein